MNSRKSAYSWIVWTSCWPAPNVMAGIPWRVSPAVSVWRQPFILAEHTSAPLETGAAASATFVLPLPRRLRLTRVNGIYVTAGAKSEGYIPGEQVSGGGILRAGLSIHLN